MGPISKHIDNWKPSFQEYLKGLFAPDSDDDTIPLPVLEPARHHFHNMLWFMVDRPIPGFAHMTSDAADDLTP